MSKLKIGTRIIMKCKDEVIEEEIKARAKVCVDALHEFLGKIGLLKHMVGLVVTYGDTTLEGLLKLIEELEHEEK